MRYLIRKLLSAVLPFIIIAICIHGILVEFTAMHFYIMGIFGLVLASIACGKMFRRIIYFPIRVVRKVLFHL